MLAEKVVDKIEELIEKKQEERDFEDSDYGCSIALEVIEIKEELTKLLNQLTTDARYKH